ncbi:SRPBCC family protein [Halorubellus sp. JP-L1]|uniref:SRPBCC family protein n=1 Tax=Halorubellus sp. JP-L1 TaxID=2715753 RepID=UPI001409987F|nr:SRPBCC family protein [Halorubellus sp. JP-L1]NHN40648.1 SRPBCC family protein [Halorubellus sp. JP-L1]
MTDRHAPEGGHWSTSDRTDGASKSRLARRATSVAFGSALLLAGLRRRTLRGAAMALAGAGLVARGLRGLLRAESPTESGSSHEVGTEGWDETPDGTKASRSVTVDRSAEELHELWRDPTKLSEIMGHFADVTPLGDDRLRWSVDGPRGREFTWETHVVEDEPGERIRWETPADATVPNEGSIRFHRASGGRGTVVTLAVEFHPPGGALGTAALERLDVVPEALVATALDRFKSLAESDEIPTRERNPSGRGSGDLV